MSNISESCSINTKVLLIQYAGDYREVVRHFAEGGDETYYAQKYSVETVAEIAKKVDEVATLSCMTKESYDEILENKVRAIGAGFSTKIPMGELIGLVEKYNPTHLIVRTPITDVFRWAIQKKVKTLATLADSFNSKDLRSKIRNYQLGRLLNNKQIDWVGNHGINASVSLTEIGVKADKVIPWDWVHNNTPEQFPPKLCSVDKSVWNLIYVGLILKSKGVGDILRAVSSLKKSNKISIKLKLLGKGDVETFTNLAQKLHIEDCVDFCGLLPNKDIIPAMSAADIVLIPSRHEYPEGLPITIYEALCSRTPIIASDHPMFCGKLIDETSALIFPSGNSIALANCIEKLVTSPELYMNLSVASYDAWKNLQIPVKWADFIYAWLSDSPEDRRWLFSHRLSSTKLIDCEKS